MIVRANRALVGKEILSDISVDLDDLGQIRAVRPARRFDPEARRGLLVPGLVNAHLHLELAALAGRVPGGDGLPKWVARLTRERTESGGVDWTAAMVASAASIVAGGTVAVCDVANGDASALILAAAGLHGVVQRELLTMDARRLSDRIEAAGEADEEILSAGGRILVRPSPHAPYSTAPALIRAAVLGREENAPVGRTWTGTDVTHRRRTRPPASIHVAEDRAELQFLRDGTGPWAQLLDRMQLDWRWFEAPGTSPIAYLDALGVLGPGLILVHGVHLSPDDRNRIVRRRSPLCLCPRSNLHIGGELPDVTALVQLGAQLCLGTDSLASAPDLDVLGEVTALLMAFPALDPALALSYATAGGADALSLDHLGRIEVGKAPGLVLLEVDDVSELRQRVPRRKVLAPAGLIS